MFKLFSSSVIFLCCYLNGTNISPICSPGCHGNCTLTSTQVRGKSKALNPLVHSDRGNTSSVRDSGSNIASITSQGTVTVSTSTKRDVSQSSNSAERRPDKKRQRQGEFCNPAGDVAFASDSPLNVLCEESNALAWVLQNYNDRNVIVNRGHHAHRAHGENL